jgi:phage-related protein
MASADVESLVLQITGDTKSATDGLNTLIDTLDRLKKATEGGCGLSAVTNEIGNLANANTKMSSSNKSSAVSFGKLATKVTAAWLSLRKGSQIIGSWITESNSYVENMNLFNVAMGQYATDAMTYANQVSDAMGIDTSEWIRAQGVFMTLSTGFGVVGDRASEMSQMLTQLGYDLSSFYNISVNEAMSKLKSGLAGELEPLRSLGYDLSQAKLEAIALSLGIDKAVSSMTQAEKAELRYYAIMTQVTDVHGDMARTLEDPANQVRIFTAQVNMAARALGNIFIPALNAILPYAIAAVKVIRYLADAIANLFGFVLPEVDDSPLKDMGDSAGDASNEIDGATESAKKLRKTLLGIDELNVLPDKSGGGADTSGTGFNFDLPKYSADFINEATNSRVNEIVEKMKEWLGITGEIKTWADLFDTRLGQILKTVGLIGAGLLAWRLTKGFLDSITLLKTLLSSPSYSIAIGVIITIVGVKIAIDGITDAIKNGLDGFNFAEILGGSLLGTGGIAILASKLATWISSAFAGSAVDLAITQAGINLGVGTAGAAGAALAGAGAAVILGLGAMFVGIYDAIKNGIDWLSGILIPAGGAAAGAGVAVILTALGTTLAPGIGTLIGLAVGLITDFGIWLWQNFDSVEEWFRGLPGWGKMVVVALGSVLTVGILPIVLGVITLIKKWDVVVDFFKRGCSAVGQFFVNLWKGIVSVWNTVAKWFDTNVIKPVVGFFSGLWKSVSGFFVNLWADIVTVFVAIPGWFNTNVIEPVAEFFVGLWTGISTAASKCWDAIVTFFSPAVEWFSALFSSVWQTISDIFYNIGVIASGCWQIIEAVWGIVSQWFDTNVIQPVGTFFTNLWNGIQTVAVNAWNGIKTAAINAWNGVKSMFVSACDWLEHNLIRPVGDFFTNLWNGMKTGAITAWNGIKGAYASVTTWISTNIILPVTTFFVGMWTGFVDGAKSAWEGIKSVFGTVGSFFKTTFQNAWSGVVKVFSVAGEIFTDIKDGIVTAFKSIVNSLIKGINKVVSIPFDGINSALRKIRDIKILGVSPFSDLKTISIPSIPYLAQGGVVDAGQVFVANEAGPELVANVGRKTAVMNNDQIVESVSRGVYQAVVQAMGSSRGDQVVEAKVNDKVLFEVVVSRARQETMRTGYNPLLGGV